MMKHVFTTTTVILALAWVWAACGQPAGGPGGQRSAGLEAQEAPGPGERGGGPGGPGGGPGGGFGMPGMPQLTQEQQAAIRAMNQASAPLDQAITEARNMLNAAIYADKPDPADIKGKVEKLAAAELARALARAEVFAKLQASPNKLNLPPQQIMMLMNMRGGRGGFGGPGGPGGFGGGPGGFGGPGGAGGGPGGGPGGNQQPPIKGGFEWID